MYNQQNNNDNLLTNEESKIYELIPIFGASTSTCTQNYSGDPRKETFCHLLKNLFFPYFKIASFIFIISIIDALIYFIMLFIPNGFAPQTFLQPSSQVLNIFGWRNVYEMRFKYQLQRFITPLLLNSSLMQLVTNILLQMLFGFPFEAVLKTQKTIIIYTISGIGGILFSSLVSTSTCSVGSDIAYAGILGADLAYIILNWYSLANVNGCNCCSQQCSKIRTQLLCFILTCILFKLLMSLFGDIFGGGGSDHWGQLGGAFTGFMLGLFMVDSLQSRQHNWERKCTQLGVILTFIYFILGIILFYVTIDNNAGC